MIAVPVARWYIYSGEKKIHSNVDHIFSQQVVLKCSTCFIFWSFILPRATYAFCQKRFFGIIIIGRIRYTDTHKMNLWIIISRTITFALLTVVILVAFSLSLLFLYLYLSHHTGWTFCATKHIPTELLFRVCASSKSGVSCIVSMYMLDFIRPT